MLFVEMIKEPKRMLTTTTTTMRMGHKLDEIFGIHLHFSSSIDNEKQLHTLLITSVCRSKATGRIAVGPAQVSVSHEMLSIIINSSFPVLNLFGSFDQLSVN